MFENIIENVVSLLLDLGAEWIEKKKNSDKWIKVRKVTKIVILIAKNFEISNFFPLNFKHSDPEYL